MKRICLLVITLFAGMSFLSAPRVCAAAPKLEGPVVTVANQDTKYVSIDVRRTSDPLGTSCLTEFKLNPGDVHTVNYSDLADRCKDDTKFLVDAYGITHLVAHTALLNSVPAKCTAEHALITGIKITCQP